MGRPLKDMFFGDPAQPGSQLKVTFGALATAGWIMKQVGSRRYRCTDGTLVEDCELSLITPTVAGTCNITIGGNLVSKLTAHRATIVVDASGNVSSVPWTDADLADAVVLVRSQAKPKPVKAKAEKPKETKSDEKSSFFKKKSKK